jgi:hypothetical protein
MLDMETLAVSPNATILTIGAQGFDPFSDIFTEDTYYERIDLDSQEGRDVDDSTVEWWGKQSEEAQAEAFGEDNRIPLKDALEKLTPILWKAERIWANGTTFDIVILENAYRSCGLNLPWQFWQVMDARTVYKMQGQRASLGNNHNALEDCVKQIDMLQECLKNLGVTKLS